MGQLAPYLVYLSARSKMTREKGKKERGRVIIMSTSRWSKREEKRGAIFELETTE